MATTPLTSSTTLPATGGKPPITVSGSHAVIQAIVNNQPFPATPADVTIGQLTAQASTGKTFQMSGIDANPVTFTDSISAQASACLAAYLTPSKLQSDLGFQDGDGRQLAVTFPSQPPARYMVTRWGFDVSGSASGKMALNPAVNLNFGASGSATGLFAFVLSVDPNLPAGDAFNHLLTAWCTPGEVANNGSALQAGAWIVTEVTGQLTASLGVDAGYDFNWVKSLKVGGLDGDIGLRIALGLEAALTATLGGKYYLVVNRDTPTSGVRLRLFRATTKGWGFALNANASITPSTAILPSNLDDFIKGILGTSHAQLLKFLTASNLTDIGNALGGTFLRALRADQDVTKAFSDLQNLLNTWNNLPNEVTSVIWKAAAKIPDLNSIKTAAQQISTLSEASIKTLLDSWLHDANYLNNPICQWLEATAAKSLFELYESDQLQQLRRDATKLTGLLDGSTVQSTLTSLKSEVDKTLDLPALEAALNAGSLVGVSSWVVQRLAEFLGINTAPAAADIAKINASIATIRDKAQQIYSATWEALNNTYGFSLDYSYQLSSAQSALIDVVIADSARAQLTAALRGDFTQILAGAIPGVTLNNGTLTHSIQRHSHVEVHLPWWTGAADDLATGYATAKLADSENGRVQLYEAGATDTDTYKAGATITRFSRCSVGISGQAAGIRQYNDSAVDFGFSWAIAQAAMTRSQFEYDFAVPSDEYFPNVFGDDSSDPNHAIFDSWVVDWDKYTDQASGTPTGDGVIGNTWARLQVQSRAARGQSWVGALLNGPTEPDYRAMSRAMQKEIRKWLLASYASDPSRFKNIPQDELVSGFLVYTALPPLNDFTIDGGELSQKRNGGIIWDVLDADLTGAVTREFALSPLTTNLISIRNLLLGITSLKQYAKYYDGQQQTILGYVLDDLAGIHPSDAGSWYVALLNNEVGVLKGAQSAFEGLRKAGARNLRDALPALAVALTNLVVAFNSKLKSLDFTAPQLIAEFAPVVFQRAVNAMFPALSLTNDAMLDVVVLKGTTLVGADQEPTQDQVLLRHRITSFA